MLTFVWKQRPRKQIGYALGYLFFLSLLLGLTWAVLRNPTPPPVPTPPSYRPITLEKTGLIKHQTVTDIALQLNNPNPHAGTGAYPLIFTLFNEQGQVMHTFTKSTYLTPGQSQLVAALSVPVVNPARVEITLPANLSLTEVPTAITLPSFSVFLSPRTQKQQGSNLIEEQKGLVTNTSGLSWQKVEVTSLGLDANGQIHAVGQTFVGELKTGEQREFTLQWPQPAVPLTQVLAIPSTNVYQEENIVKALGDPSRLR
jgi:hypothetical protein